MKKIIPLILALALLSSISIIAAADNWADGQASISFTPFTGSRDGVFPPDDPDLPDDEKNWPVDWVLAPINLPFGEHAISSQLELYTSDVGESIDENTTGGVGIVVQAMRSADWHVQLSITDFNYTDKAIGENPDLMINGEPRPILRGFRLSLHEANNKSPIGTPPMTINEMADLSKDDDGVYLHGHSGSHRIVESGGVEGIFGADFNAQLEAPAASVTREGAAQATMTWVFVG